MQRFAAVEITPQYSTRSLSIESIGCVNHRYCIKPEILPHSISVGSPHDSALSQPADRDSLGAVE